jgi:hypothetical protein
MEGQCLCGTVKVKVHDDNLFGSKRRGHLCHCSQCRKVAGGLFGANLTIETEKVEISGEENLTRYDDPETLSGTPVSRYFCKTCGAYVEWLPSSCPVLIFFCRTGRSSPSRPSTKARPSSSSVFTLESPFLNGNLLQLSGKTGRSQSRGVCSTRPKV